MTKRKKIGIVQKKREEGNAKGKVKWEWNGPEGFGKQTERRRIFGVIFMQNFKVTQPPPPRGGHRDKLVSEICG